jgi:probable F420-dependent oxidoreductase
MKIGISFPTTAIGTDVSAIRDYILAVEGSGYDHMTAVDHILGAHPDRFDRSLAGLGLTAPPYTDASEIHEVFTLFSYAAAITERVKFATSILILPQRQTQLVAKQAAQVDVLSRGRMRLGIGVGWNYAEMEAMGIDFKTRGRRMEEQIEVLRRLWTEPLVSFSGRWHTIDRLSINPRPVQASIPVWIGCGNAEPLMRRVARLADGWMPRQIGGDPNEDFPGTLSRLHAYAREAGRDPSSIGVNIRISVSPNDASAWLKRAEEVNIPGVTEITLSANRDAGTPRQLIDAVPRFKQMIADVVPA